MARKGWDSLSPAYRKRLEGAGLSKTDYESGRSLQRARGHANTPENPRQFSAAKYPKYAAERRKLASIVEQKKARIFGQGPKWNPNRSIGHMREKPPSLKMLRWAIDASDEEILDAIREDPEAFYFLGYH